MQGTSRYPEFLLLFPSNRAFSRCRRLRDDDDDAPGPRMHRTSDDGDDGAWFFHARKIGRDGLGRRADVYLYAAIPSIYPESTRRLQVHRNLP